MKKPNLLIVDDNKQDRVLTKYILSDFDINIFEAVDGLKALEILETIDIHVLILDVNMPNMDGFELAESMQNNESYIDIPIIFTSALFTDEINQFKGYQKGAIDYLIKPYNKLILQNKVKTYLSIIQNQYRLEEEIFIRTEFEKELTIKNKYLNDLIEEKNDILQLATHDLKTPLTKVALSLALLKKYPEQFTKEQISERINEMQFSTKKMINLITELLDLNKFETGVFDKKLYQYDILPILKSQIKSYHNIAKSKGILINFQYDNLRAKPYIDEFMFTEVVENLLSNSVKYTYPNTQIVICAKSNKNCIRIEFKDEGPGLTNNDKKILFNKFAKLSTKPTAGESTVGLGLSIVKKLVTEMNGKVWCESELGKGSTFIIEFPIIEKEEPAKMNVSNK